MSLIKLALIESGQRTDLPNAWQNNKKLGVKGNIPLAKGINSSLPSVPNLS